MYIYIYIYIYISSRAADRPPTVPHQTSSDIRMLRRSCGEKKALMFTIAAELLLAVTKVKYGAKITSQN